MPRGTTRLCPGRTVFYMAKICRTTIERGSEVEVLLPSPVAVVYMLHSGVVNLLFAQSARARDSGCVAVEPRTNRAFRCSPPLPEACARRSSCLHLLVVASPNPSPRAAFLPEKVSKKGQLPGYLLPICIRRGAPVD